MLSLTSPISYSTALSSWTSSSSVTLRWPEFHNTTTYWPNQTEPSRPKATITVGAGGRLEFSPPTLEAPIGTIVQFDFLALNHTLTQSSLWDPCSPLPDGFNTGFAQFNPKNISGKYLVEYEVTTKNPQFFFCAQNTLRSHCRAGMVFSLNTEKTAHESFVQNALEAVTTSSQAVQNGSCPKSQLAPSSRALATTTTNNTTTIIRTTTTRPPSSESTSPTGNVSSIPIADLAVHLTPNVVKLAIACGIVNVAMMVALGIM
ncbi:hypothetical protein BU24DRAFT_404561 [Aaosphaeria arxii CBS 175.79]|uniref:Cupredoxin n=1 Tax=Aaosphaeria arxii CBS 175.79 TaxID=1450172 RepID=A0A6A5Y7K9_9PLEO|nr:uncharacterized protein BU24DRAFT_404561 [Aaosphaeria arxii CBS 175.79]KAF2021555.1 hypothetical protein BU24DRAFT_404561 [Aaosphaeria arxii CBS 175.79]